MSKIIHVSGGDHITADLLADGPETFTITDVIEVELEEGKRRHAVCLAETEGKTWVPALTIIKAFIESWGRSISNWKGQKVTLYRDPDVRIGKQVVGGIRVSHATGISNTKTIKVRGAQNRPVSYTFQPLPDASPSAGSITPDMWATLQQRATDKGITEPWVWVAEQLGRRIEHPQQITRDEAETLLREVSV